MSVRAEKPRRLMLLPIVPPSAAAMVMPGTLRSASENELTACDCSTDFGTTTAACGMSRSAVGTLAPTLDLSGWKSLVVSACPVTLTAGSVALLSEGWLAEGWLAGEDDVAAFPACEPRKGGDSRPTKRKAAKA